MIDVVKMLPIHLYYLLKYLLSSVFLTHPDMAGYIREKCRNNIIFWLEFYVSFPETPSKTPFIFKNYQYKKDYIKKLADNIKQGKGLVVSKSEDMGATELTALVLLWYWMFHPDCNFAVFARNTRKLCTVSNPETIFGLYRYVLERTPERLLFPKIKEGQKAYRLLPYRDNKLCAMLVNTFTGNVIYGFSGGKISYFPRSRAFKAVWFDDMAFHRYETEHYHKVKKWPVIATSCPNGTASTFYDLTQDPELEQYRLHWSDNPDCDESWHQHILETLDPVYIEQFLNINFDYKYKRQVTKLTRVVPEGEEPPVKKRRPRRRQQSTFLKTFAGAQQQPVKRIHRNNPEQPRVVSFEEYKARRQQELRKEAELDTLMLAMSVINVIYGEMYFYNKPKLADKRFIIRG
jgi:hypothetical protein